jgi:hypothetical protein
VNASCREHSHSGSMEPAYYRGDLLFLSHPSRDVEVGDVVVYKIHGRDIPIVHRVLETHHFRLVFMFFFAYMTGHPLLKWCSVSPELFNSLNALSCTSLSLLCVFVCLCASACMCFVCGFVCPLCACSFQTQASILCVNIRWKTTPSV